MTMPWTDEFTALRATVTRTAVMCNTVIALLTHNAGITAIVVALLTAIAVGALARTTIAITTIIFVFFLLTVQTYRTVALDVTEATY
jgi:hypothetical protein